MRQLLPWTLLLAACGGTTERIVYVNDCPDGHAADAVLASDQAATEASVPDSATAGTDAKATEITAADAPGADAAGGDAAGGDAAADSPPPKDAAPAPDSAPDSGPDSSPTTDVGPPNDTAPPAAGWPKRTFAPYTDSTLYPFQKLTEVAAKTGQRWFTLAFVVAKEAALCKASWGTYYTIEAGPDAWLDGKQAYLYDDLAALRTTYKGDVVVSFGGASNTPLEEACGSVNDLAAQMQWVVDMLKVTRIDFDIEGIWLTKTQPGQSGERRAKALLQLQQNAKAAGKELKIGLTLPVLPNGLTPDGVATLEQTLQQGVKVAFVNLMAMDYGDGAAPNPKGKMAQYAADAATATHAQLKAALAKAGYGPSDADVWAMLGLTPMIGLNDVKTETFTVAEASTLLGFANSKGLGWLGMWSVNRDHPCPTATEVQLKCSSVADQTEDWQFTKVWQAFSGD